MGCTSTRRHALTHVAVRTPEKPEPLAEPAMAANVALKPDPVDDSQPTSARTAQPEKRRKLPANTTDSLALAPEAPLLDSDSDTERDGDDVEDDESADQTVRTVSSMDRLNAALNNSDFESGSLPQRSLTTLNERLHVDALLVRAKKLLEIGQVDQAHNTALQAQQIGDTAQIEYAPDEDRPIDLVRQIEGQLEAIRLKLTPQFESTPVETADASEFDEPKFSDEPPAGALSADSKATRPEPDTTGLARIRRDWSTMFRQKKRGSSADAGSAAKQVIPPSSPQPPSKTKSASSNRQASRSADTEAPDAVVQANRSVSLEGLEPDDLTVSTSARRHRDEHAMIAAPTSSTFPEPVEGETTESESRRRAPEGLRSTASQSTFDSDDADVAPPDFDVVEPVTAVRHQAAPQLIRSRPAATDDEEPERQSDWTLLYVGFGLCSILAFGCYRRGAT